MTPYRTNLLLALFVFALTVTDRFLRDRGASLRQKVMSCFGASFLSITVGFAPQFIPADWDDIFVLMLGVGIVRLFDVAGTLTEGGVVWFGTRVLRLMAMDGVEYNGEKGLFLRYSLKFLKEALSGGDGGRKEKWMERWRERQSSRLRWKERVTPPKTERDR